MARVITYCGAYTAKQASLCERHANDDSAGFSLGPVQHGEHEGACDACERAGITYRGTTSDNCVHCDDTGDDPDQDCDDARSRGPRPCPVCG